MIKLQGKKYNQSVPRLQNILNRQPQGMFSWNYYIVSDEDKLTKEEQAKIAKLFRPIPLKSIISNNKQITKKQLEPTDWAYQRYIEQKELGLNPEPITDILQQRQNIREASTELETKITEVYGTEKEKDFFAVNTSF